MRYSIIIPHCHAATESALQQPELDAFLERLGRYELLTTFAGCPTIEHAVVAGLRAARGETVIIIEPGDRYPADQWSLLLRALSRADFVWGRRRRVGWPKLVERLGRLPRWLFLGRETRDSDCLFWAARREVFNGLPMTPRFVRYLPALVAQQGYRVDSAYVEPRVARQTPTDGSGAPAHIPHVPQATLLAAWWECYKLRRAERANAVARQQTADAPDTLGIRRPPVTPSSDRYTAKSA